MTAAGDSDAGSARNGPVYPVLGVGFLALALLPDMILSTGTEKGLAVLGVGLLIMGIVPRIQVNREGLVIRNAVGYRTAIAWNELHAFEGTLRTPFSFMAHPRGHYVRVEYRRAL